MRTLILILTAAITLNATKAFADDPHPVVTHARQALADYHAGTPTNGDTLRVIYFVPKDVEPQADYQQRLTRIMLDMQSFYRDEMQRNGFGSDVFPLEIKDGKLKVHLVRGRDDHTQYKHESGNKTVQEIRAALRDTINLDREHVLIFHGMCTKKDDGSYFFYAPYYGDGSSNHIRGLCHAADCEMLDPNHLTNTDAQVRYNEHYGDYTQSLAEFNTKYLGGIAHEMGHGLSLPHNAESPEEKRQFGPALMGAGNHTYRRELRGRKGTFLTLATATRLASHPLFTRRNTGRFDNVSCDLTDLRFTKDGNTLTVTGTVNAEPAAYAVIAYHDPDGRSDYDARTFVSTIADNTFSLTTASHNSGHHDYRITICHLNGATTSYSFQFNSGDNNQPDIEYLNAQWLRQDIVQLLRQGNTDQAISRAKSLLQRPDLPVLTTRQLQHLITTLKDPPTPISPIAAKGKTVHLSDLTWQSARVGWRTPKRDLYNAAPRSNEPLFLELNKTFYPKGLYAHAPSTYTYNLAGRFNRFTATVGLQDGHADNGSAVFVLLADDKEVYRSDLLKGRDTREIDIPLAGVNELKLIVETGKADNAHCWAVWAAPTLHR